MSLPNFIVSGFPKCGSTALHYYLNEHPEIYMPKQKELHFFTNEILAKLNQGPGDKAVKKTHIKTIKAYKKCFNGVTNEIAIGDASPSYINYPETYEQIKERLNDPKVIILLRDPIKRAFSNYLHLVREGRETLAFDTALNLQEQRKKSDYSDFWNYTFNSTYFDKVVSAKAVFSDVLILTQEALNSKTEDTIKTVFQFLGVDTSFTPNNLDKRYNPGGLYKRNIVTKLIFGQGSFKRWLKKLLPTNPKMKHLKQKVLSKYKTESPEVDAQTETYLVNCFKNDVKKLKALNIDLEDWNENYFV